MLSKRSDTALEAIARGTGGTIVKLGLASGDLGTLYESKIEPLARRQHEAARLAGKAERFPLFLLTAFVFLILGCFAGEPELALELELAMACKLELAPLLARLGPAAVLVCNVCAAGATQRTSASPCGIGGVGGARRKVALRRAGGSKRLWRRSKRRSSARRARRSRDTTPPPRCFSSSDMLRPASDTRRPACAPAPSCE